MFPSVLKSLQASGRSALLCTRSMTVPQQRFKHNNFQKAQTVMPTSVDDVTKKVTEATIHKVNQQVEEGREGRLFAVAHVAGKQFKVTNEDIIIIAGYWPPQPGDQIKLEKILLAGGEDFTLVGRPLLPPGLVSVTATVIDKDLSHTKPLFYKRRRKQYRRLNFIRAQYTMLRINEVAIAGKVDHPETVTQYSRI